MEDEDDDEEDDEEAEEDLDASMVDLDGDDDDDDDEEVDSAEINPSNLRYGGGESGDDFQVDERHLPTAGGWP